jgi:hypothetical protein
MFRPNNKIKYDELVSAVASGETVTQFCADKGLARSTGSRWAASPEFRSAVDATRREMIGASLGVLASSAALAAATLVRLVSEGQPGDRVRLGACEAVIKHLLSIKRLTEQQAEIDALKAEVAEIRAAHGRARGRTA